MKVNHYWHAVLLISAIIISILGYNFHTWLWELFNIEGWFYKCMALFILILFFVIWDLSFNYKLLHAVSVVGLWLAGYNLADELFFDPTFNSVWEWVMAGIVISHQIYKYKYGTRTRT